MAAMCRRMNYDLRWAPHAPAGSASFWTKAPPGQAEACHFPPPNQFPPAETGYWVISYPLYVGRCAVSERHQATAQSRMGCRCCVTGARGWQPGWFTGARFFPRSHNRWAFLVIM